MIPTLYPESLEAYLDKIRAIPLLTRQDEIDLAALVKKGDEKAREKFIVSNLRLVYSIAEDYRGSGMAIEDIISEGNRGLSLAVERFDPSFGVKFSTYAMHWIKQKIRRAISNQARVVRVPVHIHQRLYKMRQAKQAFEDELGVEPTDEELAEKMGMPLKKLIKLKGYNQTTMSLDTTIGEAGDTKVGDLFEDEAASTPFVRARTSDSYAELMECIGKLDSRAQGILIARFGLDGDKTRTLEKIGSTFKVTRERIRQIEQHALKQLREMIVKRNLIAA